MFQKILLPLDGSEVSEAALPYADELASRLGGELVLYHVHSKEHEHQQRMYRVYLESLAHSLKSHAGQGGASVSVKVEAGEVRDNICSMVDTDRVDLIVMTAVSASGLRVGKMLGAVTDHVCRTVPVPVLLVRPQKSPVVPGTGPLLKQVLLPTDGSDLSRLAFPVAMELASRLQLKITLFEMATLFRVYDDGSGQMPYIDYKTLNDLEQQRVEANLKQFEGELRARGLEVNSVSRLGFDAAQEIIELSGKINADLVIMSTHGRTGLGRWIFGNVAEKVLRHGNTPLLLVHASAG